MKNQKSKIKDQKYIVGVDIGGTKIAAGIITKEGKLISRAVLPTLAEKGVKVSLNQVYLAIENILNSTKINKKHIIGIGVCAPGPLDPVKGIVYNPPNLPGWRKVELARLIGKRFGRKVKVENDANAAGMAETVWGAARGYKNVFYVTVSTGIGTGIIIDGQVYHGKNGMAGEGGHMTINYDDKSARCNCGNYGCIEALASGPHTARRFARRLKENPGIRTIVKDLTGGKDLDDITMVAIGKAASKGDKAALDTIKEQADWLGIWLANIINVLDPEIIVIGGGVSLLGKKLFDRIRKTTLSHTINIFAKKTPIVRAKLMENVGIYGAASIWRE